MEIIKRVEHDDDHGSTQKKLTCAQIKKYTKNPLHINQRHCMTF